MYLVLALALVVWTINVFIIIALGYKYKGSKQRVATAGTAPKPPKALLEFCIIESGGSGGKPLMWLPAANVAALPAKIGRGGHED